MNDFVRKTVSLQKKLLVYLLSVVSIAIICSTLIISMLVTNQFFTMNEQYTLSGFAKTEVEIKNIFDQLNTDFTSLIVDNIRNSTFSINTTSDAAYAKSLINIREKFDTYHRYDIIGLLSDKISVFSVPQKSFIVYRQGHPWYSTDLYSQIMVGRPGLALQNEFTGYRESQTPSPPEGNRIIYFTKNCLLNQRSYTLILGINENTIANTYKSLLQEHNNVYIIDSLKKTLSTNNSNLLAKELDYYKAPEEPSITYRKQIDGREYQIIEYTLNDLGWRIVNEYPAWEYKKSVYPIMLFIIFIFLCCLLVSAISIVLLVRRITHPLNRLSSKMIDISQTGVLKIEKIQTDITEFDVLYTSFRKMTDEIQNLLALQKLEEQEKNKLRVQALMAQINPHFIYNTLSTIKVMADISECPNISNMIQRTCQYIKPAFRVQRNRWTFSEEYSFLEDYFYILGIRFGPKINIQSSFPAEIHDYTLPRFLIQPLVENSVFHGMKPEEVLEVAVRISLSEDAVVTLCISDNGIGMGADVLEQNRQALQDFDSSSEYDMKKIGLKNIVERLHSYYKNQYTINIESEENKGTAITITFPLQSR